MFISSSTIWRCTTFITGSQPPGSSSLTRPLPSSTRHGWWVKGCDFCDFCDFWVETCVLKMSLGVLGRPESDQHSDSTFWDAWLQKNGFSTSYYCWKLLSQCYKYHSHSGWCHKAWRVVEMGIVHGRCLFPGSWTTATLKMQWTGARMLDFIFANQDCKLQDNWWFEHSAMFSSRTQIKS